MDETAAAPLHPKPRKIVAQSIPREEKRICSVKPPPDPYPMLAIPSTILAEHDYVDAVSTIIERDYFPDLKRLRAEDNLLDAQNANDLAKVARYESELENIVCTPMSNRSAMPCAPMSDAISEYAESEVPFAPTEARRFVKLPNGKSILLNTDIRLDSFHSRYTSEDNASFEALLTHDKAVRRQKEAWMEEKETRHNERVAVTHALTDDTIEIPKSLKDVEALLISTTRHEARNMLYWKQLETVEQGHKLRDRPAVRFKNTRFPTKTQNEDNLPQALKRREEKLNELQKEEVFNAALFNGEFGNVKGDILHTPDLEVTKSPMMTYGRIASAPQCVDTGLDHFQFTMPDVRPRDALAQKLTTDANSKHRNARLRVAQCRYKKFGITPRSTPASAITIGSSRSIPASSPISVLLQKCERAAKIVASGRTPMSTGRIRSACTVSSATPRSNVTVRTVSSK